MSNDGIRLKPFFFHSITLAGGGLMPDHPGAHAAWYYCRCGIGMLEELDEGVVYVGELDRENRLANLARGISKLYGLESPSELTKYIFMCRREAARRHLKWDVRLLSPHKSPDFY